MAIKSERFNLRIPPEYCAQIIQECIGGIGKFKAYDAVNKCFLGTYTYVFQQVEVKVFSRINKREVSLEVVCATDDIIGTGGLKAISKLKQKLLETALKFEDFYDLEQALNLIYVGDISSANSLISKINPIEREAIFLKEICVAFITMTSGNPNDGLQLLLSQLQSKENKDDILTRKLSFIAFKLGQFKASATILLESRGNKDFDENTRDFFLLQLILCQEYRAFVDEALSCFPGNIDRLLRIFENKEAFEGIDNNFNEAFLCFIGEFKKYLCQYNALHCIEYLRECGESDLPQSYDSHYSILCEVDFLDFSNFHSAFINFIEVIRRSEETAIEHLIRKHELLFSSVAIVLEDIEQIRNSIFSEAGNSLYNDLYQKMTLTVNQIISSETSGDFEAGIRVLKSQYISIQKLDSEYREIISNYLNNNIKKLTVANFNELKKLYKVRLRFDKYSFEMENRLVKIHELSRKKFYRRIFYVSLVLIFTFLTMYYFNCFVRGETSEMVVRDSTNSITMHFKESEREYGIISDNDNFLAMMGGPGDNFQVIRKITAVDTFFVLNDDTSGWVKIQMPDSTIGYIQRSRIDILTEEYHTVVLAALSTENEALEYSEILKQKDIDSEVLYIPNYSSLSGKPLYAIISGHFLTKFDCETHLRNFKQKQISSYGVLVSNSAPSQRYDILWENKSFFDGMSDLDIKDYASMKLNKFSSIVENEELDEFIEIFANKMRIYHNYRNTNIETIILNSRTRYFSKWIVLKDSVYDIVPSFKNNLEFVYKKFYKIQSRSNTDDIRVFNIEGMIKFDDQTGLIVELDDTFTERIY